MAVLHYTADTRTDTLSFDIYTNVHHNDTPMCDLVVGETANKLGTFKPTHIVTAITYGGDAHFVFKKVREAIKKSKDLGVSLKLP